MSMSKLISAALLALPLVTQAATIDFESATTAGCQVTQGGSIDGFTLSAFDDATTGGGFNNTSDCNFTHSTAHSGRQFMLNFNSVVGTFTRDVGTFDLLSLWVSADERDPAAVVRFTALDAVGGNVLFTDDFRITSAWTKVTFVGWTGVKAFTWDSLNPNSSNIAIDDFEYASGQSVPEPLSLALVGLALAGAGVARRRKA